MIHLGDCIEVMAGMEPESVDAIVTDPPYGLEFMGKEWDAIGGGRSGNPFDVRGGKMTHHSKQPNSVPLPTFHSRMTMPKCAKCGKWRYNSSKASQCVCDEPEWTQTTSLAYPHKMQAWHEAWGREALRVTKPGGYLLAFGGTRTHHRLVCGLEDAGWIIRDELTWVYASGFPKGRANLKPAHEPIVLARKPGPLRPLGIDAGRIGTNGETPKGSGGRKSPISGDTRTGPALGMYGPSGNGGNVTPEGGRWPSNLLLSDPELFDEPNPEVVGSGATGRARGNVTPTKRGVQTDGWGNIGIGPDGPTDSGDAGGYSRFFIVPKADRADREPVLGGLPTNVTTAGGYMGSEIRPDARPGRVKQDRQPTERQNAHPTVKPVDLMRHLIRLVTPSGGTVLDCFAGSGSTLIAAELEGFPWVGIEKEPEYVAIAEARLNGTQRGLGLDVGAPIRKAPKGTPPEKWPVTDGVPGYKGQWRKPEEEPAA